MLTYDPKDAVFLFPQGEYDAELLACEEKTSKADNPMYKLQWRIFGPNGQTMQLTSWIAFPKMTFQLKRLAQALDKLEDFEKAKFNPGDYIGSSVRVTLKIEQPKVQGLSERNAIAGYLPRGDEPSAFAPDSADPSEVPF